MKKVIAGLIMITLVLAISAPGYADNAVDKLGRGLANVATSPLELIKGMDDAKKKDGYFAAFTTGILKGTVNIVKRASVGVFEVATFPVPLPADYKPILKDPEYFLEKEDF
ncbi:MAG: exosortase system-associated protein, TIGR04073 family [Candidatus Tantalella remota]|nr:exosortase system-associated protein, TIGR04073 family [Candidatus Tantalella remota]